MLQVGIWRGIQVPQESISKPSGWLPWGQWQEKSDVAGERLHPQETENESATPFAVPPRGGPQSKGEDRPLDDPTPFLFFRASLAFLALQH